MLHMDNTPEYMLSIAGCVERPPATNWDFCCLSCLTVKVI